MWMGFSFSAAKVLIFIYNYLIEIGFVVKHCIFVVKY